MLTPNETLGMLDDAIAVAEQLRKPRKTPILDLTGSPTVLGQTGVPGEAPGEYQFTLAQCRKMRDHLLAAAGASVPWWRRLRWLR